MMLVWNATWRPTSAPSTPLSMKFPYLILATLTPASLAPSWLPPVATVCRPHRVRVSRIWKMTVRMTAQMISDHASWPIQ